jgi:tRNA1(Val) A37 N6-methylase TrmN6
VLDLGAGIGSVGLMVLRLLGPGARLVAVEVQAVSADLARRSAVLNGVDHRVEVRCADLRDPSGFVAGEDFDLITANPPFLPPHSGSVSANPQRRAARFELNGDVFDYCEVAARHLAPGGRFVLCHAAADPRPEEAITRAGLTALARQAVVFRAGRPPHLALWTCAREGDRRDPPELVVRGADGQRSDAFVQVLRDIGIAE